MKNKGYAKFFFGGVGANKVHYGRSANGKYTLTRCTILSFFWREKRYKQFKVNLSWDRYFVLSPSSFFLDYFLGPVSLACV